MNIRPKTMRRLMILFAAMLGIFILFLGFYIASVRRNTRTRIQLRAQAMAAYQSGDFANSVTLLSKYLDRIGGQEQDPDAVFAYGKSRISVEMSGGRHIIEAIHIFEQYLQNVRPGDVAAQRELLKLYVRAHYFAEAVRLADEVLGINSRDTEALQQKVLALIGQHKLDAALASATKLNVIAPQNLNGHIVTIYLMSELHTPAEQVIAHAQALRAAHPNDPRFEVVLAVANAQAKQDAESKKWLQSAAAHAPPDADFVLDLTGRLDAAELFAEANSFLTKSAAALPAPAVQRLMAQRLWQDLKVTALEDRLKHVSAASPSADGELLGYRALALFSQNKVAEAGALVSAMSHRSDSASAAWAQALGARFSSPPLSAVRLVSKLQPAVERDPENPVLRAFLAEGYLGTGEAELAIAQSTQAAQRAPSWAAPFMIMARALSTAGRNLDALRAAAEAMKRATGRYDAESLLAQCDFAWVAESGQANDYAAMLPLLEDLQKTWHDPRTLPIYVAALARGGKRPQAISVLREQMKAQPPLDAPVLLALAEAADHDKLELGQELRDLAEKTYGLTPQIALEQARAKLSAGNAAEGHALLAGAAKGHETEVPWRLVLSEYDEAAHAPGALKNWIALGDQYPDDLALQQSILRQPSRAADRAFWARTIDRVKASTGEQALLWRIERSRWLLAGELPEREKAEAVNLLTQVTHAAPGLAEPHLLLAMAMEKVNNRPAAIVELTAAADRRPGDFAATRELVRLLLAAGRNSDAVTYLDKLAQSQHLSIEARHWLARAYADQGNNDKATALLLAEADGDGNIERNAMLAGLYRKAGRTEDAARLYKTLLGKPITDAAFWADAADFFAAHGDMPTAKSFLAKLADLPLNPGDLQVFHGRFAEQWISTEEAEKDYRSATQAAPNSAGTWVTLAAFYLRRHQMELAIAASSDGLRAMPQSPLLKAVQSNANILASLGSTPDLQFIVEALGQDPRDAAATEMLTAASAAQQQKLPPDALAKRFKEIADRNPSHLAVQLQTARMYRLAGQPQVAIDIARKAADVTGASAPAQQFLTQVYASTGQWDNAEQAALLWRQHSADQPAAADVALAEIYLQGPKKNPAGAIRAPAPLVANTATAQNPRAVEVYASALVLAGRGREAADLLKPLATESAAWRTIWLNLAASQEDASIASNWIDQVVPLLKPDAREQYGLASAWYAVGSRFDSTAALDKASAALRPLLAGNEKQAPLWALAALIAQAQGDYDAAALSYRRLIELTPSSPDSLNNLAYVLWLKGDDSGLPEAKKLAERAISLRPNDASFCDTLARIQAKSGDRKAAIASFRTALQHDPNSVEARIGLADLLLHPPTSPADKQQAKDLLAEAQRLIGAGSPLPSVLRKQYQTARDAVADIRGTRE